MFFYDVQDCIGTIDGSHIKVEVHNEDKPHYRDRKVDISQNIMVICSFNLKFFYMNAGWEGLAVDFTLLYSFLRDLCASRLFYYFIFIYQFVYVLTSFYTLLVNIILYMLDIRTQINLLRIIVVYDSPKRVWIKSFIALGL